MFSIILPTYQRAYCIRETISSVVNQTCEDWELIVVDNYSTDETEEYVKSFGDARIRFIQINNDGVIAKSRNYGILQSNGAYLAFIDSDDPWEEEKLMMAKMYLSEGHELVYHDLHIYNGVDKTKRRRMNVARDLERPVLVDLIKNGNGIPTSSVVVKRKLVEAVGGFSEDRRLIGIEDYDLWVRISRISDRFFMIDQILGYYTDDGAGTLNHSLRRKSLNAIQEVHRDLHMSICGMTPDWLVVAWCRTLMKETSGASLYHSIRFLKEKRSITAKAKLVLIAIASLLCLSLGYAARKRR